MTERKCPIEYGSSETCNENAVCRDCTYPKGLNGCARLESSWRMDYLWHGKPCLILTKPVFRKGIKRNALIQLATGEKIVIPWRSIRKNKAQNGMSH